MIVIPRKKRTDVRGRYFASVAYPESLKGGYEGLIEILSESHVPCAISPLHDKDFNADGEPKKPHYHVLLCYENVTTENVAREVIDKFGGAGCELIRSQRGYFRYLTHKDNPDKAQYDPDMVVCLNGLDPKSFMTDSEINAYFGFVIEFIKENEINTYWDLCCRAMEVNIDLFYFICTHTLFCRETLNTRKKFYKK